MLTVIGIPVYYHYCGGELEEITYVLKSNSCCGGEEEDDEPQTSSDSCCKDEHIILKSDVDFTFKKLNDYSFVKAFCEVFYIRLPFSMTLSQTETALKASREFPPPGSEQELLVSTFILRI